MKKLGTVLFYAFFSLLLLIALLYLGLLIAKCIVYPQYVQNKQVVCKIPALQDGFVPQGLTHAGDNVYLFSGYNGKAMVNSVNGKSESMAAVFPLVKKYGGVIVALTLDEDGIPETAKGRVEIAKKILSTTTEYGISKKDIIFDTLAMTISADNKAAFATLDALKTIKNELGCRTSLGVSNISFGLPNRDAINSTFFAMALENGLLAARMNPYSVEMRKI